jgi:hypothetical protein
VRSTRAGRRVCSAALQVVVEHPVSGTGGDPRVGGHDGAAVEHDQLRGAQRDPDPESDQVRGSEYLTIRTVIIAERSTRGGRDMEIWGRPTDQMEDRWDYRPSCSAKVKPSS